MRDTVTRGDIYSNSFNTQAMRLGTLDEFIDSGLRGLYGGETLADIIVRKGLQPGQNIFEWMNPEERAANRERAVLTIQELQRLGVRNDPERACRIHYEIGKAVRQRLLAAGKIPPERQPTPKTSGRAVQRDLQRANVH